MAKCYKYFKNNSEAGIEISLRIIFFFRRNVDINRCKKVKIMERPRYQNLTRSSIT